MFCPKCGRELKDGERVCKECGSEIASKNTYNWGNDSLPSNSDSKYASALNSNSMLLLCIFYTINIAFSFISSFMISAGLGSEYAVSSFSSNIFSNALPILLCVGLWMIYNSAKSKTVNSNGVLFVKIVTVIQLVLRCLGKCIFVFSALASAVLVAKNTSDIEYMLAADHSKNYSVEIDSSIYILFWVMFILAVWFIVLDIIATRNLFNIGTEIVNNNGRKLKTGLIRFIYIFRAVSGTALFFGSLGLAVFCSKDSVKHKIFIYVRKVFLEVNPELYYEISRYIHSFINQISFLLLITAFGFLINIFVYSYACSVVGKLKKASK